MQLAKLIRAVREPVRAVGATHVHRNLRRRLGPLWWAAELQRQEPAMQKPSYGPWEAAKQLDSGHHWPDPVVTYSFPGWNDIPGFSAFSYDQQVLAELVLDLWS